MANPVLEALRVEVENDVAVMSAAKTLIDGIAARVQAAVNQALQNGATEAELAPVQTEVDALKAGAADLSAAVAANTPSGPAVPKEGSPAHTPKPKH